MTLPVQDYLRRCDSQTFALQLLRRDYGVNSVVKDGLAILNYDQLDAIKGCPVADDCRALTLRVGSWDVVASSFRRFYNLGERPDESLDWSSAVAQEKLDGSLMVMFHDGTGWRVNTRGSFADQPMTTGGPRWCDVFWRAFDECGLRKADFDPDYAYSFELCTPWNQVVVYHDKPQLFLLAAFDRDGVEMEYERMFRSVKNAPMGATYRFDSPDAARLFVESRPGRSHEGVVVRDDSGRRVKVKSTHYLHYHRLKNNGHGFSVSNLVPLILAGEGDEVAAVFPEASSRIRRMTERVAEEMQRTRNVWDQVHGIESQKEFALAVIDRGVHPAVLFTARKNGRDFQAAWRSLAEKVLVTQFEKEFGPGPETSTVSVSDTPRS